MTNAPNAVDRKIAIVAAQWHADIVDRATASFIDELGQAGVEVDLVTVPGAFEIPLQVQRLARTGRYAGVAACAFVVNGGIYRHEFVSATVVDALMRVQLDTDVPVFSAVLTPLSFHEHEAHTDFFREHFVVKGRELARAVLEVTGTVTE